MKFRSRYSAPPPPHPLALSEPVSPRRVHRTRSTAPSFPFPRPADSPSRLALRVAAAIAFVTLGQMKFFASILLGTDAVSLPSGPEGFGQYLAAVGVPFPLFSAYVVCLVEMLCGVGLVLSAFLPAPAILTRLAALPLAVDMTVAFLTVGLRNAVGDPVRLEGVAVTHQVWRLPLELGLLLITLLLLWRPLPERAPPPLTVPTES